VKILSASLASDLRHARANLDESIVPFGEQLRQRRLRQRFTSDDDEIDALGQRRARAPERLADEAFGAIASDRVAYLFRGDDSEPSRTLMSIDEDHERARPDARERSPLDADEVGAAAHAPRASEALGGLGGLRGTSLWETTRDQRFSSGDDAYFW
jgi:hypothetical protein